MPELILPTVTVAGILIIIGLQIFTIAVVGALYGYLKCNLPKD